VTAILTNRHPEKPVVYYSRSLQDAKTWKTPQGVRKARAQVGRGDMIMLYKQEERGQRVLCGMLGKNGEARL
jgi:hypothetical protein